MLWTFFLFVSLTVGLFDVEICIFLLEQFSNKTLASFEILVVEVEDFESNFCADEVVDFVK